MTDFDRADWDRRLQAQLRGGAKILRPVREARVREAAEAEHLVGTLAWDHFVERVTALRQECDQRREAASEILLGPTVDTQIMLSAKLAYAEAAAGLAAFDAVLVLPKEVLEAGAEAQKALHEERTAESPLS